MTYRSGIRDKPAVMQSNYTVIVMGLKLGSPLCQNTDPSPVCVYVQGLLITGLTLGLSGPSTISPYTHTLTHAHTQRQTERGAVIEKQLVYLGESLLLNTPVAFT